MNFGYAIDALKDGKRVARAGWNGKGMFVFLNKGQVHGLPAGTKTSRASMADAIKMIVENGSTDIDPKTVVHVLIGGVRHTLFDKAAAGQKTRMPSLGMQAADGSIVTGWLASQTDMLAEDWEIVP